MRSAVLLMRSALAPYARRFRATLGDPEAAQQVVLDDIASRLARTAYGRSLGVRGSSDFKDRVPVVGYDDLEPWIDAQKSDESQALVADRVLFYEKTSGSSGPAKYIPYNAALRRSFSRMFMVWAHDLAANGPRFRTGKLYFSISPSFGPKDETGQGVPVGLDDDADYLDGWLRWFMGPFFVSPAGLSKERDPAEFKRRLCEGLIAEPGLEVISIWNPSFLKVHLDWIAAHRQELLGSKSSARLSAARRAALASDPIDWHGVWPELKLISCWASANAQRQAEQLAALFPGVMLQGKGLLATEAPITVPLIEAEGDVPMLDEVLIELQEGADGPLRGLHEVDVGGTYEVVVSQKGGLCRYRMNDRVKVTHRHQATPCLQFVGRGGQTSDLVGEKLNEDFVRTAVEAVDLPGAFVLTLVPVRAPADHYVLMVDRCERDPVMVAAELEQRLMASHHYRQARLLGQLGSVRLSVAADAADALVGYHQRRGMKWGDVKHHVLLTTAADDTLVGALT